MAAITAWFCGAIMDKGGTGYGVTAPAGMPELRHRLNT